MSSASHIIRTDEVALTECGLFLPGLAEGAMWRDDEVVLLDSANVATWPSTDPPRGAAPCGPCFAAYIA